MDPADLEAWARLVEELAPEELENLGMFDDLAERLRTVRAPDTAAARLGGVDTSISAVLALAGPAPLQQLLAQVAPELPGVLAALKPRPTESQARSALWALSYLNAARCAGSVVPDDTTLAEAEWLGTLASSRTRFNEPEQHALALAACACGQPGLVTSILDAPPPEPFVPGVSFGFNVPDFVRYLAAAIEAGHTYDAVEPAWLDFVQRFPIKLDAQMLDWPALLWAARAVYATLGGRPVVGVGDELHRLVTST
jgi:hypothetical protein